jgi:hypothetical protein
VTLKHHRALLAVWIAYLRCLHLIFQLDALPQRDTIEGRALRPSTYTPLLLTLTRQPFRSNAPEADDEWSQVDLARVLKFMNDVGTPPTIYQLQLLLQYYSSSEYALVDVDASTDSEALLSDLRSRRNLLSAAIKAISVARPPTHSHQAEALLHLEYEIDNVVMTTLERANRLSLDVRRGTAVVDELEYWISQRDNRRSCWRQALAGLLGRWEMRADSVSPSDLESRAIVLLLRDRLVRASLHDERASSSYTKSTLSLSDPLDLLRLFLGRTSIQASNPAYLPPSVTPSTTEETHLQSPYTPKRTIRLVSCIIRLYTYFYKHYDVVRELELLDLIVQSRVQVPRRLVARILAGQRNAEGFVKALERVVFFAGPERGVSRRGTQGSLAVETRQDSEVGRSMEGHPGDSHDGERNKLCISAATWERLVMWTRYMDNRDGKNRSEVLEGAVAPMSIGTARAGAFGLVHSGSSRTRVTHEQMLNMVGKRWGLRSKRPGKSKVEESREEIPSDPNL